MRKTLALLSCIVSVCLLAGCSEAASDATVSQATAIAGPGLDIATSVAASVASDLADPHTQSGRIALEATVRTAYILNASIGSRWPYYAADRDNAFTNYVHEQLLVQRYSDDALSYIMQQRAEWPAVVNADHPTIHIDSLDFDESFEHATLSTRESWNVTDEAGSDLFTETDTPHTVTLHVDKRFHETWVVDSLS